MYIHSECFCAKVILLTVTTISHSCYSVSLHSDSVRHKQFLCFTMDELSFPISSEPKCNIQSTDGETGYSTVPWGSSLRFLQVCDSVKATCILQELNLDFSICIFSQARDMRSTTPLRLQQANSSQQWVQHLKQGQPYPRRIPYRHQALHIVLCVPTSHSVYKMPSAVSSIYTSCFLNSIINKPNETFSILLSNRLYIKWLSPNYTCSEHT